MKCDASSSAFAVGLSRKESKRCRPVALGGAFFTARAVAQIGRGAVELVKLGHALLARHRPPRQAPPIQDPPPASIELPADLDRVLRDYESAWRARDAKTLAALFAPEGYVLPGGRPPVVGRDAIARYYTGSGGPLALRAFHYRVAGDTGYILGGYAAAVSAADDGKFTLTLRRDEAGRWWIVSDMDNRNRPR